MRLSDWLKPYLSIPDNAVAVDAHLSQCHQQHQSIGLILRHISNQPELCLYVYQETAKKNIFFEFIKSVAVIDFLVAFKIIQQTSLKHRETKNLVNKLALTTPLPQEILQITWGDRFYSFFSTLLLLIPIIGWLIYVYLPKPRLQKQCRDLLSASTMKNSPPSTNKKVGDTDDDTSSFTHRSKLNFSLSQSAPPCHHRVTVKINKSEERKYELATIIKTYAYYLRMLKLRAYELTQESGNRDTTLVVGHPDQTSLSWSDVAQKVLAASPMENISNSLLLYYAAYEQFAANGSTYCCGQPLFSVSEDERDDNTDSSRENSSAVTSSSELSFQELEYITQEMAEALKESSDECSNAQAHEMPLIASSPEASNISGIPLLPSQGSPGSLSSNHSKMILLNLSGKSSASTPTTLSSQLSHLFAMELLSTHSKGKKNQNNTHNRLIISPSNHFTHSNQTTPDPQAEPNKQVTSAATPVCRELKF